MKKPRKVKKMWEKIVGSRSSPYQHMDKESVEAVAEQEAQPKTHSQGNVKSNFNKDVKKEKKKRKGWKRIGHAALMTCRYIGMGVSHMSPVSTYAVPDYNVDPVWWCNSVQGKHTPAPHWTTGIILNNW